MTLETILRTVLHAVAWSALVAFCGVVAGVGVRWMLRTFGDALSETMCRHGRWVARRAVQEAGMWRTRKTSKTSDNENLCQS